MHNGTVAGFGELILRLHSSKNQRFVQTSGYDAYYGGAEANVCVLLARLGIKTEFISKVPTNDLALAGIQQLRSHGVGTSRLIQGGDTLGMYFTESGNQVRPSRVIYNRANSSFAKLTPGSINWNEQLEGITHFHWSGVSAAISDSAAQVCAEALQTAAAKGITICSDFNYRSTLWQYGKKASEVMPPLLEKSTIIVADLDSCEIYYGIKTDKSADLQTRFRHCYSNLKQHIPGMKYLGMSFRKTNGLTHHYSGALMANDEFFYFDGFDLPIVTDQIGSGDAFTAGLLSGIITNEEPSKILPFAVACGALKQSMMGDWALVTRDEVNQFIQTGSSGRIIR
ncbi:MAG: sugar kinase [Chitinophagaceae bacterium]|nr:MAG: sugar kinase [Chitinophagaceae bacterium]